MSEQNNNEMLINEEESLVLEAIAQSVIPHSQRAQALLAVDAGSTVDQAAAVAGLKITQVRYWIGRFRNGRLQIFPEELLTDIETLIKERETQAKAAKKTAKKSTKAKSKKESSGSVKKDKKKLKPGKKKKDGKPKDKKKSKTKKPTPAKSKKGKKKKAGKKNK